MISVSNDWKKAQLLPLMPEANVKLVFNGIEYDKKVFKSFKYVSSGSLENKVIVSHEITIEAFNGMLEKNVGDICVFYCGLKLNGSWEWILIDIFQVIKKEKKANSITTKYILSNEYSIGKYSTEIYEEGSLQVGQGSSQRLQAYQLAQRIGMVSLSHPLWNALIGQGLKRVSYGEARQKLGIALGRTITNIRQTNTSYFGNAHYEAKDLINISSTDYVIHRMNFKKFPEKEPLKYTSDYIVNFYSTTQSNNYDVFYNIKAGNSGASPNIIMYEAGKYAIAVAQNAEATCELKGGGILTYKSHFPPPFYDVYTDIYAYYATEHYEQKTYNSYFDGNDETIIADELITSEFVDYAGNYLSICSSYNDKIILDLRIDPCLELFDKVAIEQEDGTLLNCIIEKIEMKFNGSFSGNITLRTDNNTVSKLNYFSITRNYGSGTVYLTNPNGSTNYPFEYSFDRAKWLPFDGNGVWLDKNSNKMYIRGNNDTLNGDASNDNYWHFTTTSDLEIEIGGDISSLYDKTMQNKEIPTAKFFARLFKECTSLTSTSNLQLTPTTLKNGCYWEMFSFCTHLANCPQFFATTLESDCYESMFWGCTLLQQVPTLNATTLADSCYAYMFWGCTSLQQAPALIATTLADSCYKQMFYNCSNLITPPTLPAENIAPSCYMDMFAGCSSLLSCPELPATTLYISCYDGMFRRCTALTTMPNLPATVMADWCYASMFELCENLVNVVSLPSTQLAEGCYAYMFIKCYALGKLHNLPATNLPRWCYRNMYEDCSNIKIATSQGGEYQTPYRIPTNGSATAGTDALLEMFTNTGGTFVGTPTENTVYYTSNTLV